MPLPCIIEVTTLLNKIAYEDQISSSQTGSVGRFIPDDDERKELKILKLLIK